jgi:DNA-binding beta-propeller fold protein YncE
VALIDANTGKSLGSKQAGGSPTALAVDPKDGSVWVADSSATLTHVDASGNVIGSPIRVSAPAKELGVGEGWLWVVDGAAPGLIRASRSGSSAGTGVDVGPAIGVTFDSGVWVAGSGGRVTRVDPRPSQPRSNGQTTVAPDLDGIAAVERGPYVWAISASAKALYRITNASRPAAERAVTFASPPVALAVIGGSVWVATADGKVTQIAY